VKVETSKTCDILLITETPDDIRSIQTALSSIPCEIKIIHDGQQALEFVLSGDKNVDIVLMDDQAPSLNALEYLRKIKENGLDLGFIFLTSSSHVQMIAQALHAGASDFLVKSPSNYPHLPSIVEKVHRDQIDKKIIKQALRQYVDIVNNMQLGLYVIHVGDVYDDRSLKIVDANTAAEKQMNVLSSEIIDRSFDEVWPELRAQNVPQVFLQVIQTELPQKLEIVKKSAGDNKPHHFSLRIFPLPNQHVGVLFEDITQLVKVQDTLQRRENVLEAVSFMARSLLRTASFEKELYQSLARIGDAIQCRRVYIYKNNKAATGAFLFTAESEWIKPGSNQPIHIKKYEEEFYAHDLGPTIKERLENGQVFIMRRDELTTNQALFWEIQNITSFVLVPVFINQEWWGFVGFDENDPERMWSSPEIDALKVAAETIGGAIQRQQAEYLINKSLKEKEVLLQEIHHRVKNNLQIISSLLDMSSLRVKDPRAVSLFADARDKIYSMALIHSQLYTSEQFDEIQMQNHVQEMASYLIAMHVCNSQIKLSIKVDEFFLPIGQAIPCSLILSELISNALKHGFKDRTDGELVIGMHLDENETVFIDVADNGVGIPENMDLFGSDNIGLKLIKNIVERQLKGTIKCTSKQGLKVSVEFKLVQGARNERR
jgi:two-component sensor histidine kinase/FixJ family two-component response regulator